MKRSIEHISLLENNSQDLLHPIFPSDGNLSYLNFEHHDLAESSIKLSQSSIDEDDKTEKNRERNREHAKRTRLRKKEMMESLKIQLQELQMEVKKQKTAFIPLFYFHVLN